MVLPLFVLGCLLLGEVGCGIRAAQHQRQAVQDDTDCQSFGFAVGTQQYAYCRLLLRQDSRATKAAIEQKVLEWFLKH